eukprot:1022261-Rhodomonas_salina.1
MLTKGGKTKARAENTEHRLRNEESREQRETHRHRHRHRQRQRQRERDGGRRLQAQGLSRVFVTLCHDCLLYTSPSPRDRG